jgi:hypothetical protein
VGLLSQKTGLPSFAPDDTSIVNYFADGGFERGTDGQLPSGWLQYNDGATATPVDGTGGSAVAQVTMLITTSSPIRGTKSAVISKDAANRQGVGYSYDFTISNVDKGVTAGVEMDLLTSANYASGDVVFYIYDVTNSTLITPRATALPKLDNYGKFFTDYGLQTGTTYRFILHIATTNASAWTITFDTMVNSTTRTAVPGGLAIYTGRDTSLTTAGFGTIASPIVDYWTVGSILKAKGRFTTGTVSGTTAAITLRNSYVADLGTATQVVGKWWRNTATGAARKTGPLIIGNGGTAVNFSNDDATQAQDPGTPLAGSNVLGTGEVCFFEYEVPVTAFGTSATVGPASVTQWASDDGTSDVLGPQGSLVPNVAFGTGATNRDFAFSIPQDFRQFVRCELNYRGFGWSSAADIFPFSSGNNAVSGNSYGVQAYWISSSTFRVTFGNQGTNVAVSNVSNGGSSWATEFSNGTRFRVGLSIGGVFIGINLAQGNLPGFYQAGFAPGLTTGAAIGAGYVGQLISATLSNVSLAASGGQYNGGTLSLTPGVWIIEGKISAGSWGTTQSYLAVSIASQSEGVNNHEPTLVRDTSTQTGIGHYIAASPRVVNISANTDFYIVVQSGGTGANPSTVAASSQFYAVRIA